MFAVIFEVRPTPERWDEYLSIARSLRPELERIDGFIENNRYRSAAREGVLLSLSLWRDEKALIRWRTNGAHFTAQERGRGGVMADYRLRVGEVTAMRQDGAAVPMPTQRLDETETGDAKAIALFSAAPGPLAGALSEERFTAILDPAETILMGCFPMLAEAEAAVAGSGGRAFAVRIIRDYGRLDRREAPQFHPPVPA